MFNALSQHNNTMDKEEILKLYHDMYAAMIRKDKDELERILDDSFVLVHMSGMQQSKTEYVESIMNGTLNYFKEQTSDTEITVINGTAAMTGRSRVNAVVFGGGRHTWPLQLKFELFKRGDGWRFTRAQASTY